MKDHRSIKIGLFILSIVMGLSFKEVRSETLPKIEVIPIVIWSGQKVSPEMTAIMNEMRVIDQRLSFLHMISPIYFMSDKINTDRNRSFFASMLRSHDAVGMHIAPLVSWAGFVGVDLSKGRGLYGEVSGACESLCGLEWDFSGVSPEGLAKMVQGGLVQFEEYGFNAPQAFFVEEGLINGDWRRTIRRKSLEFDFSGFNIEYHSRQLSRFPVYDSNAEKAQVYSEYLNSAKRDVDGLVLDHLRFGVIADLATEKTISDMIDLASDYSVSFQRSVSVPIFFYGNSLVHSVGVLGKTIELLNVKSSHGSISWTSGGFGMSPNVDFAKLRPQDKSVDPSQGESLIVSQIDEDQKNILPDDGKDEENLPSETLLNENDQIKFTH